MSVIRNRRNVSALIVVCLLCAAGTKAQTITVSNPFLWVDLPDPSIVRVDSTYYMSQTTMHMAPGVPILESKDLVHWKTINFCYSTLANSDAQNLNNGQNAYGKGSWASSIRYKNGTYYVLVPSYTTGKTHLYSTKDIHSSSWKEVQFPFYHDPSLLFDDDGRNYVVYGAGDIKIVELAADLSGVKAGGVNQTLIPNASAVAGTNNIVAAEGSHIEKINGWYYVFNISWPSGSMRTELVHRSQSLLGTYEGQIGLQSSGGADGVAQGSVVQMTNGNWMAYLFTDQGSVGRCPWLVPVTWSGNWPVFNGGAVPTSVTVPTTPTAADGAGIVTSDQFNATTLHPEWQWNHNPDNANWSLTARPGYYRITTSRVDNSILSAKNSLTQRTFGPKCSGRIAMDASGMKDGDVAGLAAFQDSFGMVAVKKSGTALSLVMINGTNQVSSVALNQNRVYLRIDMDFTNQTDMATFYYSLDSTTWKSIGNTLQMRYTLGMFMGYRFALFNYATKSAGGTADFDWFKIGATSTDAIDIYPQATSIQSRSTQGGLERVLSISTTVSKARKSIIVNYDLTREGAVEIRIVDLRGKMMARLVDRSLAAGSYAFEYGAGSIPPGQYLVTGRLDGVALDSRPVTVFR